MKKLENKVKEICKRLAPHGWRKLLLKHGLDITECDLERELRKKLEKIDRTMKGFEDFSIEGDRGIEPGQPARSLLFHALASPNVNTGADGSPLTVFPTLAELEIVENYVYGITPPSLSKLSSNETEELAIVVFATEYRPAPETVHRKHADVCFSRTGVARVGTMEPLYEPEYRGFLPFVKENDFAFRVLPSRYSAYIAIRKKGSEAEFGPTTLPEVLKKQSMIQGEEVKKDTDRSFWVPVHKLFSGGECLCDDHGNGIEIQLELRAFHFNEKIRHIHSTLHDKEYVGDRKYDTGWNAEDINKDPFTFTERIAHWSDNPDFGSNVLIPFPHNTLIEKGIYQKKPLTFKVPESTRNEKEKVKEEGLDITPFYSSLQFRVHKKVENEDLDQYEVMGRPLPEYIHVRHEVLNNGEDNNLNNMKNEDLMDKIRKGGYESIHYIDFTGDGWIEAVCLELENLITKNYPAYSMIAAPDFFPNCDQRELMEWYTQEVEDSIKNYIWDSGDALPTTLADSRKPVNIKLKNDQGSEVFQKNDDTLTAIISIPYKEIPKGKKIHSPLSTRHSYLPDASSGEFAPGWDVSTDMDKDNTAFFAAYGLGSPFPEDAKLCAALSTFWPAVAPDAARTFAYDKERRQYPTVAPLTDEEIGIIGDLPWDGVPGPKFDKAKQTVEYIHISYADYVENTLQNKFTLSLTGKIDTAEYKARLLAMAYAYKALGLRYYENPDPQKGKFDLYKQKSFWKVLSFLVITSSTNELDIAQAETATILSGTIYRFEVFKPGEEVKSNNFQTVKYKIQERVILFIDGRNILIKNEKSKWEAKNVTDL